MLADAEKPAGSHGAMAGSHGAMAAGAAKRCGAEAAEDVKVAAAVVQAVETFASRTPSSCSWYQRTSQADRVVVKVEADTKKDKVKRSSRRNLPDAIFQTQATWHTATPARRHTHGHTRPHQATQDHTRPHKTTQQQASGHQKTASCRDPNSKRDMRPTLADALR